MSVPQESDLGRTLLSLAPFHRYVDPGEVAAAVGFLTDMEASYITGSHINVDGGWNA